MDEKRVQLSEEARDRLKAWILELIVGSDLLWGMGRKMVGFNEEPEADDYVPHEYYLRDELTDDDLNEIADVLIKRLIEAGGQPALLTSMANDLDVLMDAECSARWLRPFVGAERTTVAYERGVRLALRGEYGLAHAILQEAADNGDAFAAMYLIQNTLEGTVRGFLGNEGTIEKVRRRYDRASLAYETALALIAQGEKEQRWSRRDCIQPNEKRTHAEEILRENADRGDTLCAMYLIEQTLHAQYNRMRG